MPGRIARRVILAVMVGLASGSLAWGEPTTEPHGQSIRVLWWEVKPFCFEQGTVLTGFGCEMIEAVLAEAGLPYEMIEVESSAAALERLTSGGGDVIGSQLVAAQQREALHQEEPRGLGDRDVVE